MQPILIYFAAGLTISLVIGVACYYTVGHAAAPLLKAIFGDRGGAMWGRLFRMSVVTIAIVGGLSSKFYGCGGPTDYADIADNHAILFSRTSDQVAGSLSYSLHYLLIAAAIGAIAFAVRGRSAK
jgi:hypothetical protein